MIQLVYFISVDKLLTAEYVRKFVKNHLRVYILIKVEIMGSRYTGMGSSNELELIEGVNWSASSKFHNFFCYNLSYNFFFKNKGCKIIYKYLIFWCR